MNTLMKTGHKMPLCLLSFAGLLLVQPCPAAFNRSDHEQAAAQATGDRQTKENLLGDWKGENVYVQIRSGGECRTFNRVATPGGIVVQTEAYPGQWEKTPEGIAITFPDRRRVNFAIREDGLVLNAVPPARIGADCLVRWFDEDNGPPPKAVTALLRQRYEQRRDKALSAFSLGQRASILPNSLPAGQLHRHQARLNANSFLIDGRRYDIVCLDWNLEQKEQLFWAAKLPRNALSCDIVAVQSFENGAPDVFESVSAGDWSSFRFRSPEQGVTSWDPIVQSMAPRDSDFLILQPLSAPKPSYASRIRYVILFEFADSTAVDVEMRFAYHKKPAQMGMFYQPNPERALGLETLTFRL